MSHFTVAVCCKEPDELHDRLLPFRDNGYLEIENPSRKWDSYGIMDDELKIKDIDSVGDDWGFYAYLDLDGDWCERGNTDDIDKKFKEYLKEIDKETYIITVDCHL